MYRVLILSSDNVTARTLYTVNSLSAAQKHVDELNRDPAMCAWWEKVGD